MVKTLGACSHELMDMLSDPVYYDWFELLYSPGFDFNSAIPKMLAYSSTVYRSAFSPIIS